MKIETRKAGFRGFSIAGVAGLVLATLWPLPAAARTPWTVRYEAAAQAAARGDYAQALPGFQALADVGSPAAEAMLGHLHLNGLGTPRNPRTAAVWYFRAAEKGYAPAQMVLGRLFSQGIGFRRNPARAYFWTLLAITRGDSTVVAQAAQARSACVALLTPQQIIDVEASVRAWRPTAGVPR